MRQMTLFDEEELTGLQDDAPEELRSIWKKAKQDMRKNFTVLQELPYEAWEDVPGEQLELDFE